MTDDTPKKSRRGEKARLLQMSRALREVARITHESAKEQILLDEACAALEKHLGFSHAWAANMNGADAPEVVTTHAVDSPFVPLLAEWRDNGTPTCITAILAATEPICLSEVENACEACTFQQYGGDVWGAPLRFQGSVRGLLVVIDHEHNADEAARSLLMDAAADIAAGLHRLEQRDARQQAERRFQLLMDNLMGAVYQCRNDERWSMRYLSAGIQELTGYSPEQLLNGATTNYADIIHPEDRDRVWNEVQEAVSAGNFFVLRYRIVRADGRVRWVVERGHTAPGGDGESPCLEGLITDVTEQVQQEERLRASEEKFRHIFENKALAKCIHLPDGSLDDVNQRLCDLLGYSAEELKQMAFVEITHPDDLELSTEISRQLLEGSRETARMEKRYIHKSGTIVWVDISTSLIRDENGVPMHFVTAMNDITERKKMERALRKSSHELQGILEVAMDLFCITDNEGHILKLNQEWEKVLGYPIEELQGAYLLDYLHPGDMEETLRTMESASEGKPVLDFVNRYQRKDGTIVFLEWRAHPQGDFNYAAARDVTERLMREEKLRRTEARFRLLIENAPAAIFVQQRGCFNFLNPAACRLFGVSDPEELIGKPVLERFHPDYWDIVRERIRRLNELHEPVPMIEEHIVRVDGEVVPVEISAVPIRFEAEQGALVFMHDQTLRKRDEERQRKLESQLQQAQKMESVGRLAGGVAHDFNNLLMPILGHAELLASEIPPDSPFLESIQEILAAAERARGIASQLLSFSREKQLAMVPRDLNEIVQGFRRILGNLLGEDISMLFHLAPDPLVVDADTGQLEQVLMNLAVNARDAMPQGGRLRIETSAVELDEEYIEERPSVMPGPYALMTVTDEGTGMDEGTRNRIFDPFFTTKEHDRGTGLGLSTVYGIIKQHGGHVWVYSEVGHGTTFKVYLPLVDKNVHTTTAHKPASSEPALACEPACVLVLEDLAPVRKLVVKMLKRMGHSVLEAESLAEAQSLASQARCIDLMVSDVILPDCKGPQAYEIIRERHEAMRVIYMSGYTESVVVEEYAQAGMFLQKPFTAKALAATVVRALSMPPPTPR